VLPVPRRRVNPFSAHVPHRRFTDQPVQSQHVCPHPVKMVVPVHPRRENPLLVHVYRDILVSNVKPIRTNVHHLRV
jgi:hypothetical protein